MFEVSFGLLKPDAVHRNLEQVIFSKIIDAGLLITDESKFLLEESDVEYIYGHNKGLDFWQDYVGYMTYCPVIGFKVNGESAINTINLLVGYYKPEFAKEGTIRKELAIPNYFKKYKCFQNLIHSSVDIERAEYELRWFDEKSR